jgi:hypothetical protein
MNSQPSIEIPLPFTDAVLRLIPRWSEWSLLSQVTSLALFGLVPLAVVILLYRYELRLVSRSGALGLLALRLLVIVGLWFVVCLQPVVTSITTQELPSRVLVAVDISDSMNVTDPGRPHVDKLKLARALGLAVDSDLPADRLLNNWIEQYDRKGTKATKEDIQWEDPGDGEQRHPRAEQRRALHDQICAEVDKLTRTEVALRLLAADGGKLLKDLEGYHGVEILGFHRRAKELNPEQLKKILRLLQAAKPADPKDVWELKPEQAARIFRLTLPELDNLLEKIAALKARQPKPGGWFLQADQLDQMLGELAPRSKAGEKGTKFKVDEPPAGASETSLTDLASPLKRGLKPSASSGGRLTGIVLLTDGRHNAEAAPDQVAEELGKRGVPILPVVIGTNQARPSVTLAEVQAPSSASARNVEVTVRVRFKVAGMKAQNIVVKLERADRRPLRPRDPEPITIAHNGEDQYYDRSFVVGLDPKGRMLQTFVVQIEPEIKLRTGNPSQRVVIRMNDVKAKVLVVDGEARWEYHYLANALGRDPSLSLHRVLFEPPLRNENISDDSLVKMGNPQRRLPEGPDALADFQCIILGDVSPEQVPLKDRERLEQFVAKHGGTLVIVAGKRFTPLAYTQLPAQPLAPNEKTKKGGETADPIVKLLPIKDPQVVRPEQGFPVTLTAEGKATPFLKMEAETRDSEERWAEFPPHYWGIIGRAKPGATTLAYFRDPTQEAQPPAGKNKDENQLKLSREQSLIARHNYGRGQVLYIGLDSTWRWRYRIGDTYHHRFWSQVIRWAASDYVQFGTDKPIYQEGQDVLVDLSLEGKEMQALPAGGELRTRIVRIGEGGKNDKVVALVPLNGSEGLRVLKGRVRQLPPGRYRVELDRPDKTLAARLAEKPAPTFLVKPRDNKEMDHLETNEELLKDLARKSGDRGHVYTPVEVKEVVQELKQRTTRRVERSEWGLWQTWGTLVLFLVLLTAEWVGRKWAGLP